MMWFTHIAFGVLAGVVAISFFNVQQQFLFVVLTGFAAILADVDHEGSKINQFFPVTRWASHVFKHRGVFHSIFPVAGLYVAFSSIGLNEIALAVAIGYSSHLFSDSLTKMGVNLLNPISTLHMSGFIEVGGLMEYIVFGVVVGVTGLVLF
jgi:membrane-bound metal-dependent hydrolase YbcI (DUF457 family)